jgi:uncharacterized protein (DUF1697 family)
MPVYVALLRGVNLGPNKRMKMEKLRASCEALGFTQVQTYIQSGNVVFKAAKTAPAKLAKKIEERIVRDFGFSAAVLVRTREEIGCLIEKNPFLKKTDDGARLHAVFLAEVPAAEILKEFAGLTTLPDESRCIEREVFLYLPNGMGKSSLIHNPLERKLLKGATTRNWNTVKQLHAMCQACK